MDVRQRNALVKMAKKPFEPMEVNSYTLQPHDTAEARETAGLKKYFVLTRKTCCFCCIVTTGLIISFFFLNVYWSCFATPVAVLSTQTDLGAQEFTMKVLSYNMFLRLNLAAEPGTKNDWKDERLQIFIDTVIDDYDILLLQEVWTPLSSGRKEKLIAEARKRGYKYYVRSRCKGKPMDAMLLILSKHPLVANAEHTFSVATGEDQLASKGVLFARAYIRGLKQCTLDLYTTHMQAWDNPQNIQIRRQQTKELAAFVNKKSGSRISAVIAGDFNSDGLLANNYNNIIDDLAGDLNVQSLLEPPLNITYPAQSGWNASAIDYVFFIDSQEEHSINSIQAHNANIEPLFIDNQPFKTLSDHYGISFDIDCKVDADTEDV
jgi:endonuclease/exonuclease/phosphatase family metal-dependent hydrolase